ncbi:MAG: hypothetical protein WD055_03695 [Candidatus Dependentiae bacterium]
MNKKIILSFICLIPISSMHAVNKLNIALGLSALGTLATAGYSYSNHSFAEQIDDHFRNIIWDVPNSSHPLPLLLHNKNKAECKSIEDTSRKKAMYYGLAAIGCGLATIGLSLYTLLS